MERLKKKLEDSIRSTLRICTAMTGRGLNYLSIVSSSELWYYGVETSDLILQFYLPNSN
jgi:hypothetical protein